MVVTITSLAGPAAHAAAASAVDYPVIAVFAGAALRRGFAYLILAIAAGVAAMALFAPAALNTG